PEERRRDRPAHRAEASGGRRGPRPPRGGGLARGGVCGAGRARGARARGGARQESEKSTGEAHGVALYAPVHDYTFTLTARVTGPVAGVLEVRRRLSAIDAATLGPLHGTEPRA